MLPNNKELDRQTIMELLAQVYYWHNRLLSKDFTLHDRDIIMMVIYQEFFLL